MKNIQEKRTLLQDMIAEMVREELKKTIEEASTTANVAGYSTPYAFSKTGEDGERDRDDWTAQDYGLPNGFIVVDQEDEENI